jgi:hypothetical protein
VAAAIGSSGRVSRVSFATSREATRDIVQRTAADAVAARRTSTQASPREYVRFGARQIRQSAAMVDATRAELDARVDPARAIRRFVATVDRRCHG